MQAKLFFDKTVYSFCKTMVGDYLHVELHIDDPIDPVKTVDISANFLLAHYQLHNTELVVKCLLANGIDPDNYETINF